MIANTMAVIGHGRLKMRYAYWLDHEPFDFMVSMDHRIWACTIYP